jgi:HEAT repeat protein
MNESRTFRDENLGGPSRPPLGEELLPPIEQPSAKFIIQLFVVPALIVIGIVCVWLSIGWLVRSATIDPDKLVEGIEHGPRVARWQRASEFADMLNNSRNADLKRNQRIANHLAEILKREIKQSQDGNDSLENSTLRTYLAGALGEFEIQEGVDALLTAAQTNRGTFDVFVRQRAIEAMAVRIYNLQKLDPPQQLSHPDLEPTLAQLASDEDPQIRLRAIFALGKLGTPAAIEKLEAAADDTNSDVRYNAAIALAHHGNAKAADTLAEMLDLSELSKFAVKPEQDGKPSEAESGFKRAVIIKSALDAAHELKKRNPQADLTNVLKSLEQLVRADADTLKAAHIPTRIISDAEQALKKLK